MNFVQNYFLKLDTFMIVHTSLCLSKFKFKLSVVILLMLPPCVTGLLTTVTVDCFKEHGPETLSMSFDELQLFSRHCQCLLRSYSCSLLQVS